MSSSYKAFETPINFILGTKTSGVTKDQFNKNGYILPIKLDVNTADILINLSVDLKTKNPVYGKEHILFLKLKDMQKELFSPTTEQLMTVKEAKKELSSITDIHIEFSVIGTYTSKSGQYLTFKITCLAKR